MEEQPLVQKTLKDMRWFSLLYKKRDEIKKEIEQKGIDILCDELEGFGLLAAAAMVDNEDIVHCLYDLTQFQETWNVLNSLGENIIHYLTTSHIDIHTLVSRSLSIIEVAVIYNSSNFLSAINHHFLNLFKAYLLEYDSGNQPYCIAERYYLDGLENMKLLGSPKIVNENINSLLLERVYIFEGGHPAQEYETCFSEIENQLDVPIDQRLRSKYDQFKIKYPRLVTQWTQLFMNQVQPN